MTTVRIEKTIPIIRNGVELASVDVLIDATEHEIEGFSFIASTCPMNSLEGFRAWKGSWYVSGDTRYNLIWCCRETDPLYPEIWDYITTTKSILQDIDEALYGGTQMTKHSRNEILIPWEASFDESEESWIVAPSDK